MATSTMEMEQQPRTEEQQPQVGEDTPPPTAVDALEKWNQPRSNIYRTLATFWSFLVMGANDAAYGVSTRRNIDTKPR